LRTTEERLRRTAATLLLIGAAALGIQVLLSLTWVPGAVIFVLVISSPQLVAGIWLLVPWRRRRAVLYLPAILLAVFVSYWNAAVLLEPAALPEAPQLVLIALMSLLAIQALFPLIAVGALVWAWRIGRRTPAAARAEP
jgi:hypothetical protein